MTAPFLEGSERRHSFIQSFEDGTLPAESWTHAAHIAMATVYLLRYRKAVLAPTRAAIQRYLLARGKPITAYHETLTVFWLAIVEQSLRASPLLSEDDAVFLHHERFGANSKLHTDFYSFDVAASAEARARWVAPDLQPLVVRFALGSEPPDFEAPSPLTHC